MNGASARVIAPSKTIVPIIRPLGCSNLSSFLL
jgi:hypothetical protein